MRRSPFVLTLVTLTAVLRAQGPLETDEILMLLRLGVPSAEILSVLEARGGPEAIVEEDLARARELRPGPGLERWLEGRSRTVQHLNRLARSFRVHEARGAGIDILVERTWDVEETALDGGTLLTFRPQGQDGGTWFSRPTVLCWMLRDTAFPLEAQEEVADRVARLFLRRLQGHGLKVKETRHARGRLGEEAVAHLSLVGEEPVRRYRGTFGLRTRVLADGTVVSLAFAAGTGDRPLTEGIFEEMARSVTLRTRALARGASGR